MSYLSILNQTVESACRSGQIGVPVFVRCTAAIAEDTGTLTSSAADLVNTISRWFSEWPHRLYALGPTDQGHISLSVEYPPGNTALCSVTVAEMGPQIDLVILGSDGAIYHNHIIEPLTDDDLAPQRFNQPQSILEAISRSLFEGRPVSVEEERSP